MDRRMRTVASFDLVAQAQIAKNALDAAGIPAAINDGELVAMDWLISNAVGGVKVQVWEEDADRAAVVLAERFGTAAGVVADDLSDEELTRQALETGPEEDVASNDESPTAGAVGDSSPDPVDRNRAATLALLTALFGAACLPLAFVSLFYFLRAAFAPGPITGASRIYLGIAGLILSAPLVMIVLVVLGVFDAVVRS